MELEHFKAYIRSFASKKGAIPAIIVLGGLLLNVVFTVTPAKTEAVLGGPDEQPVLQTPEQAALATSDGVGVSIDSIGDEPDQTIQGDSASLQFSGPFDATGQVPPAPSAPVTAPKNIASGPGGVDRRTYLPKGCVWGTQGIFYGGAHGPYNAQDIDNKIGTPVVASCDGVVETVDNTDAYNGGYGNRVIIDHGTFETVYAHLQSDILVLPGQTVVKGEQIASIGLTGRTTGPHLHEEVRMK